jgi:folate-binding protein YgfZ
MDDIGGKGITMTAGATPLPDRGVVRVEGEDATSFLHGIVTNDVENLGVGEARFAALLSPQGKILFDFFVLRVPADAGAAFLIDCVAGQAAELVRRLSLYKLRAKATIANVSEQCAVLASPGAGVPSVSGDSFRDPRDSRLGWRSIVSRTDAASAKPRDGYDAVRIFLGVPKGGVDFAYGDAFPHDVNMDLLNGVDFAKGCYVGQEVVSRMRHRGGVRRRTCKARLSKSAPAPAPGVPVFAGDSLIGTLGSSSGALALALIRIDRLEEAKAAGKTITAGGVTLEIEPPAPAAVG